MRGQYDGYREVDGRRAGLEHRDLRRARAGDRQLALVAACRSSSAPASSCRSRRPRSGSSSSGRPGSASAGACCPSPTSSSIRIKPEPGAELCLLAKKAGEEALHRVHLDLLFEKQDGEQPEPYERLLRDALDGDTQLFPDQDAVEQTWRIVQPLLDSPGDRSSTSPAAGARRIAAHLLSGHGGWRKPWLPG